MSIISKMFEIFWIPYNHWRPQYLSAAKHIADYLHC